MARGTVSSLLDEELLRSLGEPSRKEMLKWSGIDIGDVPLKGGAWTLPGDIGRSLWRAVDALSTGEVGNTNITGGSIPNIPKQRKEEQAALAERLRKIKPSIMNADGSVTEVDPKDKSSWVDPSVQLQDKQNTLIALDQIESGGPVITIPKDEKPPKKDDNKSIIEKVAETSSKAPTGPDFTNAEKFALKNQASGKNSVALSQAKLKQWQFDQNQQRSVAGLQDQPNNTTNATNTTADPVEPDYNPGDAIPGDERKDWKPGVMHEWNTDMDIDAKAQPVSGGMSAGNAMAVKAGVALLQEALGPKKEEKVKMPIAQSVEIPWLKEEEDKLNWMSWVA